jgi:hypothetical protein
VDLNVPSIIDSLVWQLWVFSVCFYCQGDCVSYLIASVPCRFIYLFICVGTIVILVSLFGCIGAGTRNTCCLCFVSCYVPLRRHYVVLSKEDSICHAQDTKKYLELCSTLIPDGILLVAEHVNQQNFVSVLL